MGGPGVGVIAPDPDIGTLLDQELGDLNGSNQAEESSIM